MMKNGINQSSILAGLSTLLFLFIFWITLAPTKLGGWVTYVIVDGNSMEPGFYRGDLVLVRTEPAYGVGDAVVYNDAQLGSYVFHRIIHTEFDRFTLQGDNNAWLDSYQPVQDEIIGKLWVHIPKLGKAIEWMRVPLHTSVIAGLLGAILMFDMIPNQPNRKKQGNPLGNFGRMPDTVFYGFGFLALVFLAVGIFAFTRPLNLPAGDIPYRQEGQYVYSATGTPGVYDNEVVRTGEPVFPRLTCFLNIGYTHSIGGEGLQGISGSHRTYARILDEQSGWQRTIPLNGDAPFSGHTFFTTATLDLCQVESLVNLVEEQAGLKQTSYTLEIITEASFSASANGRLVSDTFSPMLVFKYNKVNFYLHSPQSQADPLYSSKLGMVGGATQKANVVSVIGLGIPVWVLRFGAIIGFLISVYGLTVAGMKVYRTASRSQDALIRLKYGGMLVDVYEQNIAPTSSVIDVSTMDDLARLADRHGTMILHMTRNFLHYYFVQNGGITYRFVIASGVKGVQETESAVPRNEARAEYTKPAPVYVNTSEPAAVPVSIPSETPKHADDVQEDQAVHVHLPAREEKKPAPMPLREVLPSAARRPARRSEVEYVIQTGEIEFDMPPDTTMLRKIKL